jgi:tRNA-dihydrouridine synthase B
MSLFSTEYYIGNIRIPTRLSLAPMSGVTCSAFRRLIKELNTGCIGLVVSEFISVEGLTRGGEKSIAMMKYHISEKPYCIQIFGHDIERICKAAEMAQEVGADIIDLNCGCPAPKVVKKGGGCELMRQIKHLEKMLKSLRRAVSCPLTVKFRSGWCESSINCLAVASLAEDCGLDGVALHPRTRSQMYRGQADWDLTTEVVNKVQLPVVGSGDITDIVSAQSRWSTGVKGLMIGRAALNNPFVFSEVISGHKVGLAGNVELMRQVLIRYVELLREDYADQSCVGRLKQLASQMCKGQRWSKDLCRLNNLTDQLSLLENLS